MGELSKKTTDLRRYQRGGVDRKREEKSHSNFNQINVGHGRKKEGLLAEVNI